LVIAGSRRSIARSGTVAGVEGSAHRVEKAVCLRVGGAALGD